MSQTPAAPSAALRLRPVRLRPFGWRREGVARFRDVQRPRAVLFVTLRPIRSEVPRVPDNTLPEIRDLLAEIRNLLLPVADAHQDEYERRLAEREVQRIDAIRALLSTDKRKKAWTLADGSLSLTDIAKRSGMAKGAASPFFKSLRELGAISDSPNPKRMVEVPQ